jgi:Domain of unknown function (DUF4440)
MKHFNITISLLLIIIILFTNCTSSKKTSYQLTKNYKPENQKLYDTIVKLDSIFFDAYNTCNINLERYSSFYADNLEFYHDQGGLMTSKQGVIDATKKYICGKVTRELVKGSIEVYAIKDFGAVEIGLQKFHNNEEPIGTPSKIGRFMILWENKNNEWKISRVVSLH